MAKYFCKQCNVEFERRGKKQPSFCSVNCKAESQRDKKDISKEWLIQKYVNEQLSTYEIGKIVGRDPKSVYRWLVDYGIHTRTRAETLNKNAWWKNGHTPPMKDKNHSESTKNKISKTRVERKIPGNSGEKNGMFGIKGSLHHNWKGGCTPERQSVYASIEWSETVKKVWERDRGFCFKCKEQFKKIHIHHIVSFSVPELRYELSNLMTLCPECHHWTHSNKNKNKDYIMIREEILGETCKIYHGDCREYMFSCDPDSIDLTVTSPPY